MSLNNNNNDSITELMTDDDQFDRGLRGYRWRSKINDLKSTYQKRFSLYRSHLKKHTTLFRIILLTLAVIMVIALTIYIKILNDNVWYHEEFRIDYTQSELTENKGYLVYSDSCRIPNLDPYSPDVMRKFRRWGYEPCTSKLPLTAIRFNKTSGHYILSYNYTNLRKYGINWSLLTCCYEVIKRNLNKTLPDFFTYYTSCINFTTVTLDRSIDYIKVRCTSEWSQYYKTGYAMIQERAEIRKRLNQWDQLDRIRNLKTDNQQKSIAKPPSVLMIGIDSVSRLNLIRSMPTTAKYLYDNDWFELAGYNKVDDNTFPNLMAVLSGLNKSLALQRCKPNIIGGLDECDLIWYKFHKYGYVTAYAEDEVAINTFNYRRKGFRNQPTDYYIRPFLITAEKHLPITKKSELTFCLGEEHSADYVFRYAVDLVERYQNDPFFGLFWANTFSHNYFSDCSSMDQSMLKYLQQFTNIEANSSNNRIVIFFSDHGMRFGPTRSTESGYYEDRLPFMFIWLSPHLRKLYPYFVDALTINRHRLTCPYDLYKTLQHILGLSGRVNDTNDLKPPESCKNCRSLLEPIPSNRSCLDVSIPAHWCTCQHYKNIYKNSKIVQIATNKIIDKLNELLKYATKSAKSNKSCAQLTLHRIESAHYADYSTYGYDSNCTRCNIYRSVFVIKPTYSKLEGTIIHNLETDEFNISGEVSRIEIYNANIDCILDATLEKYCSCE